MTKATQRRFTVSDTLQLADIVRLVLDPDDPRTAAVAELCKPGLRAKDAPTKRQLEALYYHDMLNWTLKQTAYKMKVSTQAVFNLVVRARRRLQRIRSLPAARTA